MRRGGRIGQVFGWSAAAALLALAVPATAQQFTSDSYSFIKAVRDRDGDKAQTLLDKPSTTIIRARDPANGESALHIVTKRRDMTWLLYMIAKGAPLDQRDDQGLTALADAAQLGWAEGAQQLLSVGASVDLADNRGETPLILATQAHSLPTVHALLTQGANPHLTDSVAGLSAIDYAQRDGRSQVILKALQDAKVAPKRAVAGPSITGH